ncbi:hypothetical protein SAMN05421504_101520 [Amycolatopsis xylanica]|uniref:Uncharacterized protein n=1 Tax=Amycolatopsis xylanica TaxID=589385 RepID=A0A1H2TC71_9PSEU|nr:hypothetical protein [Amycolatopsis xylanica]SDW41553.1 hypothetical protein SAMN05421504_101520 [Amycolatopsis xylanica]
MKAVHCGLQIVPDHRSFAEDVGQRGRLLRAVFLRHVQDPVWSTAVSFDVFVQGFHHGTAALLPSAAFHAVFGPRIDRTEPARNYWHVVAADSSESDIYARVDGESFDGLMLSRFTDGDVLDLVAEFARRANAVIMPVGGPILLITPGQHRHLPADLLDAGDVITVANGHDIAAAIRPGRHMCG